MKFLLLAVCASASFLSCKKQGDLGCIDLNDELTIELNNCVEKTDKAEGTLCLLETKDGRCPIGSECVWEGLATAKFSFTASGTQQQFTLATKRFPQFPNFPPNDTTVAGYKIQLLDIKPYPGAPAEPVRATVRITK